MGLLVLGAIPWGFFTPMYKTTITPVKKSSPAAFTFQSFEKVMNVTTFVSPDGGKMLYGGS